MAKGMKLGAGGRFEKLEASLASKPGVTNPGALAASIGRKKYGAEKMAKFSAAGRARAEEKSESASERKAEAKGTRPEGLSEALGKASKAMKG